MIITKVKAHHPDSEYMLMMSYRKRVLLGVTNYGPNRDTLEVVGYKKSTFN